MSYSLGITVPMASNVYHFQKKTSKTGSRMTSEEALYHWKHTPFYDLAGPAEKLKNKKNKPGIISYTMFRIINYTDICNIECSFCSFMSSEESGKGYVLSTGQIIEKTREAYERGFNQIFFQGGVNPQISFDYYTDSLYEIKKNFPDVHIRGFSPVEILSFSKFYKKSPEEILKKLIESGLDSFPGAGAEILSSRMRNILSSKKTSPEEWYNIMKIAMNLGMKASTNIVWGSSETGEEIISHLEMIRNLQDETGNILSFVPWTFQQQTKNFHTRHVPASEYLKMIALSRLFLDNIDHIEVSLLVKGTQVGEIALNCGADDINSPVFEENVLRSYGLKNEMECISFITNAGFTAKKRNFNFEYL